MIKREDIEKIYDTLIEKGRLKKEDFGFLSGYSKEEIEELGFSVAPKGYRFVLKRVDGLYEHGRMYEKKKDDYRAALCYQMCCRIEPQHAKANMKMLLYSLYLEDERRIHKYLSIIKTTGGPRVHRTYLFFLYLCSYTFKRMSPEELEIVENLRIEDMLEPDDDEKYGRVNVIRKLAYDQNFEGILANLEDVSDKRPFSVWSRIKKITEEIIENRKSVDNKVSRHIKKGSAMYLSTILEKEERHKMSDEYILYSVLCEDIVSMEESKKPLEAVKTKSDDLLDLILTKNYGLALEKNRKLVEASPDEYVDLSALLLRALKTQIKCRDLAYGYTDMKEAIMTCLRLCDLDGARRMLADYFYNCGFGNYFCIFDKMIRLCWLDGDRQFVSILEMFNNLHKHGLEFDAEVFYYKCDDAIMVADFERAQLYLDLLEEALRVKLLCGKDAMARVDALQEKLRLRMAEAGEIKSFYNRPVE